MVIYTSLTLNKRIYPLPCTSPRPKSKVLYIVSTLSLSTYAIYIYIHTENSVFYYLFTGPLGLQRCVPYTHPHTQQSIYAIIPFWSCPWRSCIPSSVAAAGSFFFSSLFLRNSSLVLLAYYTQTHDHRRTYYNIFITSMPQPAPNALRPRETSSRPFTRIVPSL